MAEIIFFIIIGLLVADFIFERVLEYLNFTMISGDLPEEISDIYSPDEYAKQQAYQKVNYRFSFFSSTFSFVLMLVMVVFSGFAFVNGWAFSLTSNPILGALFFFGILLFATDILTTPFSVYDTFVIEQKFGFNKTTPKIFVFDKLKGYLLGAVIGGGLLALIM